MNTIDLIKKIQEYKDAYWNGEPLVADSEYDKLIEELRKIDPNNSLLTQIEYNNTTYHNQIEHKKPMLSLNKVYEKEDLFKWMKSVSRTENEEFFIQPKYDGISCHYEFGIYATRGNGNIGENITNVCIAMCNHETEKDYKKVDFYGEIVIKKSQFNTLYSNIYRPDGNTFKNPRNAVAGILGTDDYMYYANQKAVITLIDYDKYSFPIKVNEVESGWDIIKGVISSLDYPMDGIVVKLADKEYAESLGATAHHPKGAIAFKFENVKTDTTLLDVEWGMGKENITATAIFEPVNLNGVTISKAVIPMNSKTLPCIYNGDFTKNSNITVERAGDVIPHIININTNPNGNVFSIDKCPFCGSEIEITESAIKCTNDNCRKKLIHKLYDALVVLGIKNIGEKNVDTICEYLFEKKGLKINLLNWMSLITNSSECFELLKGIPRFGEKSAKNIIDATNSIKQTTLAKFIASLGVSNVGIKIGTELQNFGDIDNILKLPEDILANVDGVGEIMAKRLYKYFNENYDYIISLSSLFNFNSYKNNSVKQNICFTGAMLFSRSKMSDIAQKAGFNVLDNVTKDLNILVVANDADMSSSKCKKALKYGTKIIKEEEFLQKYSN